jgi:hypothetical protein
MAEQSSHRSILIRAASPLKTRRLSNRMLRVLAVKPDASACLLIRSAAGRYPRFWRLQKPGTSRWFPVKQFLPFPFQRAGNAISHQGEHLG